MGFLTIDLEYRKFYKLSIALFLLSVTFWALFALGLEFSRERVNPSSDTPYYFPNGVFGSMTFIESATTLFISFKSRKGYFHYDSLEGKCLLVFKVLNFIGISWGIVGASLAGSHGICVDYGSTPSEEDDEEELSKCYYDVNLAANRTIAIVTVCLHVFGTIFHFILGMSEGRSSSPVRPSLAIKKTTVKLDYKKQTDQNFVNHNTGATRPTLKLASSSSSSDEDEVQFKSHDSSKGTAAPKKRVLLRRHTSVFVINADGNKEKNPQKQKSDLVPPQSLGTDRSPRGASGQRGDAQRLKNHPSSDDLLQSSRRQNSATALRQTANYVVSSYKQLKQIRSPPPSYEDAVSTDVRRKPSELQPNPYYLPPLPDQDQCNLRAPEDSHIYTGGSYPDTELVVKQPSDFR